MFHAMGSTVSITAAPEHDPGPEASADPACQPVGVLLPAAASAAQATTAAAPGPSVRLVLIGRMEAWSLASTPVLPRGRKARALLAILGLAGGEPVPRARIAGLLWSTRAPEQQRLSLRQALHEVQVALAEAGAPLLQPGREALALPAGQIWVDAREVARADPGRPEALDLLGAELLADLDGIDPAFDIWLKEQRRALRAGAVAVAAALLAEAVEPEAVARAARRLLAIDPGHESAWRSLMRAEAARGDHAAALEAHAACREHLALRHGAVPSAETEALAAQLRLGGVLLPATPHATPQAEQPGKAAGKGSAATSGPAETILARRAPRRGARIGVLPLAMQGPAPEDYLSIALAEEITAALACLRWIFVVDSGSLAAAAERDGPAAAARALGLDFLLAGTVQRSGPRMRVSLRLTDLRPPAGVVWTQRFEREADDLMALQDEVAAAVVARIDPEILLIEASRAGGRPAVGASAYELLLRAIPAIHRLDRAGFLAAGDWLREATAREPDYAPALAWYAYWHVFLLGQGWAGDGAAPGEGHGQGRSQAFGATERGESVSMAAAERLASRAIALDPLDAQGLTILGHVHAFVHHRVEEAAALHRRALALNPNLAMAWVFLGMAESYLGDHAVGLLRLDRYRSLAPCHPHAFFFDAARAVPLLLLGRHAEAAEVCRAAIALQPGFSFPQKVLLAALGHLGEPAAAVRARLLAIEPGFTVERALQRTPLRLAADRTHYARGLRLGGLV